MQQTRKVNLIPYFITMLCALTLTPRAEAFAGHYQVNEQDIHKGYITEKIWLSQFAMPQVQISDITYNAITAIPAGDSAMEASKYIIKLGMERKKPFAFISIPVFSIDNGTKTARQLSAFTLTITETAPANGPQLQKTERITAASSVLATGIWYKIAAVNTGLYKVDYNFLSNAGIDPSSISMNSIRVFGNGGYMLPEAPAVPRQNDLTENAIEVVDNNGNGLFDKDDYFIFYAVGPTEWDKDSVNKRFLHQMNIYDTAAYYFLNFDQPGLRIQKQGTAPAANETVTDYNAYAVHEQDLVNISQAGREWFGEIFGTDLGKQSSQTFSFNLGPATGQADFRMALATQSPAGSGDNFDIYINGNKAGNVSFYSSDDGTSSYNYLENTVEYYAATGTTANVKLVFSPIASNDYGYLNYIEINYRRALTFTDNQMNFRDWNSVGAGKTATYQLQNATSATQVWDVTDPYSPELMNGTLSGSVYNFSQDASMLHEFVAMNSASLYTPVFSGKVANQNLHGSGQVDLIIVTHPDFLDAANQLAAYHQTTDGLRTIVATTTQVYNEFSSGAQDISAIRDFTKMFYDRAGSDTTQMPRYLLLFGDASYDYKNRVPDNTNYVPTYESPLSNDQINSLASDDYFGILDNGDDIENMGLVNAMDIGVGRLPVTNETDAINFVNKALNYKSPNSLGPWRISSTLVADNEDDAGTHMTDAEGAGNVISSNTDLYNYTKIYEDALPFVSTPGGARCPQANDDINGQIYKGTFLVNYTGHGNHQVWAEERILTENDYNNWHNINALPFTITATCDFGHFDNPSYVSAGQAVVIKSDGGVITALTTTQESYESGNIPIDQDYLNAQFQQLPNGKRNTFGDAFRIGKDVYATIDKADVTNLRKFVMFGDPALLPDFPKYSIQNDSITDVVTGKAVTTLNALGAYTISGRVLDNNGVLLDGFNGQIYVTIYDKPAVLPVTIKTTGAVKYIQVQDNIVFRGKASVSNGHFSYTFVVPKDINYDLGKGKISSYADNGLTDAAGADTTIGVGSFSDHPVSGTNPPVVRPYIGDSLFINGGITGANTLLYVLLYSETGINVTGSAVGHDLTAVLDGNIQQPYLLNDYYQNFPNSYQNGYVSFPLSGLATGRHTITVRAWDVNDNPSEGTVDFTVVDSQVVQVQNLINYPNPFKDETHFVFEENHPNENMNAEIDIFTTTGVLVKTLKESFMPSDSRTNELTWDGTNNSGSKLPSGVYVYRMTLSTQSGIKATAYQKVVIVR